MLFCDEVDWKSQSERGNAVPDLLTVKDRSEWRGVVSCESVHLLPPSQDGYPSMEEWPLGKSTNPLITHCRHLSIYFLGLEKFLNFVKVGFLRTVGMLILSTTNLKTRSLFTMSDWKKQNKTKKTFDFQYIIRPQTHSPPPHFHSTLPPITTSPSPYQSPFNSFYPPPPAALRPPPPAISFTPLSRRAATACPAQSLLFFRSPPFFYFSSWIGRWDNIS